MSELSFNDWYIKDAPKVLNDVFGQDTIVRYYQTKSKDRKFDRNTLFIGKYGSGKTALAKIIAKSIACKNINDKGEPCETCPTCQAINKEIYDRDVVYMNGAAMSSQEVEDLLDKQLSFPAVRDAAKVFIVDETQELSKEAIQRFLTAMQAPKNGVFFIFTSMDKLKGSIGSSALQSRCKTWKMKEPTNNELYDYLVTRCKKYELIKDTTIPKDFFGPGLQFIAETSDASYRRALQSLQQCYEGKIFTIEEMKTTFDILSYDDASIMMRDISNGKITKEVWEAIIGKDYQDKFPLLLLVLGDAKVWKGFGSQYIPSEEKWKWNLPREIAEGPYFEDLCEAFLNLANKAYLKRGEWKLVVGDIVCKIKRQLSIQEECKKIDEKHDEKKVVRRKLV